MIAGGIPMPTTDHAEKVVDAALEIRRVAVTVKSPLDNSPIQVGYGFTNLGKF